METWERGNTMNAACSTQSANLIKDSQTIVCPSHSSSVFRLMQWEHPLITKESLLGKNCNHGYGWCATTRDAGGAQRGPTATCACHHCMHSLIPELWDSWMLQNIFPRYSFSLLPAFISCEDLDLCSLHLLPRLKILLLGSFNLPRPIIMHRKCLCKPVGLDFCLKGRVHLFFGLNHAYKVVLIQLTEKNA